KGRHILIRAKIDSADIRKARLLADSVDALWRGGAKFDTLVARFHDPLEEKALLTPFPQAQLPVEYQTALKGHKDGDILDPFQITDKQRDLPKFFILEILTLESERDPSAADYKDKIRETLAQEKAIRRYIDNLRKQSFVVVRL
ncbi:MAG TPA: peptidylprolyl isomerase, partial [Gemmatimonadaceae bacterium]|nr:peptidylprolyl isomerase [Gemmatimonadaceae bacterium]